MQVFLHRPSFRLNPRQKTVTLTSDCFSKKIGLLLLLVVHNALEQGGELVHAHRAEIAVRAVTRGDGTGFDVAVADDEQESEMLLAGRRSLNAAQEAVGPHLLEDMCVPVKHLPDRVRTGQTIGAAHVLPIMMAGHAGDGNLHPAIFFDPHDADQTTEAWRAFDELVEAALALGGTLAGEHGVGSLKAPWLRREIGDLSYGLQRQLKAVFDPRGLMNPGRVFSDRVPGGPSASERVHEKGS